MTSEAGLTARNAFLRATQPGAVRESQAVAQALAMLSMQGGDCVNVAVRDLEHAIAKEFPWRESFVLRSQQPRNDEIECWVDTIRWLLQALSEWDSTAPNSNRHVQVLLAAIGTLDIDLEGLSAVSTQFANTNVPEKVKMLLESVEWAPVADSADSTRRFVELSEQVKAGDFEKLRQMLPFLTPSFHSDIWVAINLLWKLQPMELARIVDARDSIMLSLAIAQVLAGDAPLLSLQVENVPFKFMSLQHLQDLERDNPYIDVEMVLTQTLLQVARTEHWRSWLRATYKYPRDGSRESRALASALAELSGTQWDDFISAIGLSTSIVTAKAAADILIQFACRVDPLKAQPMWTLAFHRWNTWNYDQDESDYLGSPKACTLDYPVSMYYANLPPQDRADLERRLTNDVMQVEQEWFTTASELLSQRNRLASRLRLVRHGAALAAGSSPALPPQIQPDDDYSEIRYGYFDVDAMMERMMQQRSTWT